MSKSKLKAIMTAFFLTSMELSTFSGPQRIDSQSTLIHRASDYSLWMSEEAKKYFVEELVLDASSRDIDHHRFGPPPHTVTCPSPPFFFIH